MKRMADNASIDRKPIKPKMTKPPRARLISSANGDVADKETTSMPEAATFQRAWRLTLAA
jgi:hypothetical protein